MSEQILVTITLIFAIIVGIVTFILFTLWKTKDDTKELFREPLIAGARDLYYTCITHPTTYASAWWYYIC